MALKEEPAAPAEAIDADEVLLDFLRLSELPADDSQRAPMVKEEQVEGEATDEPMEEPVAEDDTKEHETLGQSRPQPPQAEYTPIKNRERPDSVTSDAIAGDEARFVSRSVGWLAPRWTPPPPISFDKR